MDTLGDFGTASQLTERWEKSIDSLAEMIIIVKSISALLGI